MTFLTLEEQTESFHQNKSTNQQRNYGIVYEERRRKDMTKPSTEDNLRTIEMFVLSKRKMSYKEARREQTILGAAKVRPYDRMHVVNLTTFKAKQKLNTVTNTITTTPTDTSMVIVEARKPRNHRYVNLNPHQNPNGTELDFS